MRPVGSCERVRELLSLMADEELEPELEPIMQAHLDACPPCRGWADELVAIVRHLRGAARGTKAAASR